MAKFGPFDTGSPIQGLGGGGTGSLVGKLGGTRGMNIGGLLSGLGGATPWGSVVGGATKLIGGWKDRKAASKEVDRVQKLYDEDYAKQQAYRDQITSAFGEGGQYSGAIGARSDYENEQATTGSESVDSSRRVVANKADLPMEGQLRDVLMGNLRGAPRGTEDLPATYARAEAQGKDELRTALGNRAAGLGRTNLEIDTVTGGRRFASDKLDRMGDLGNLNRSIDERRRAEAGQFLRERAGSNEKMRRRYASNVVGRGSQSGDTVGDALAVFRAGAPADRQVAGRG